MADPLADYVARSEEIGHFRDRTAARAVPARAGGPAVTVGRVELTGRLGQPLAGYGPTFPRHTRGWMHPLHATLVLTDDGAGSRYLLVGLELHAATRWIAEAVAARTGPSIGVGIDRLFVTATHNHASPGNMYGSEFYDALVTTLDAIGFDDEWPAAVATRIAREAEALAARIEAGGGKNPRLGYGEALAWGPIWQRALLAHVANFGGAAGMTQADLQRVVDTGAVEVNGEPPPDGLKLRRKAVDARVRALTWEADGEPAGVLAFISVTSTMFHAKAEISGADGLGYAARYAEEALAGSGEVLVSVNGGAHGDTFLSRPGNFEEFAATREDAWKHWSTLAPAAREVVEAGARLGNALVTAIRRGRAAAAGTPHPRAARLSPCPNSHHFSERVLAGATFAYAGPPVNAAPVDGAIADPATARVGRTCEVGDAMLAGDPLEQGLPELLAPRRWPNDDTSPTPPPHLERGVRGDYDAGDPQSPKTTVFGSLLTKFLDKDAPAAARFTPWATLRAAHFASPGGRGLTLLGLPFEPTVRGGFEVERAVLAGTTRPDRVLVACLAGDYLGYLVTREEYMAQLYEGGSSWFGRNVHGWVAREAARMVAAGPEVTHRRAWFTSRPKTLPRKVRTGIGVVTPAHVSDHWALEAPVVGTGPDGQRWLTLRGMWTTAMDATPHARAEQEAWVRLHLRSPGGAAALARLASGRPADDKCGWILLLRDVDAGETFARWRWQFHGPLPPGWSGNDVTFQVASGLPGVKPLNSGKVWRRVP